MGQSYLRVLPSQLEEYIEAELGLKHLIRIKNECELRTIKKRILETKNKLKELEARGTELENP